MGEGGDTEEDGKESDMQNFIFRSLSVFSVTYALC